MKTLNKTIVFILALSLLAPTIATAKGGNRPGANRRQSVVTILSTEQIDTLLWMREEEKLARDVYLALDEVWNQDIFKNIASSEQKHMNALLKKINSFGLTDPVLSDLGVFTNNDLQILFDELTEQGQQSYIDALKVGATIEDLDILDLIIAIEETDDLALRTTYENLLEGSKRHLRAFTGLLQQQGVEYTPQFIGQDLFDAILGV